MRKVTQAFQQIAQHRVQEKESTQLGQQSQQASQASLIPPLDPNRLKHSSSTRFVRKPEQSNNLTERKPLPTNVEQTIKEYDQLMLMSLSNEAR
jgi:hypothetical protein